MFQQVHQRTQHFLSHCHLMPPNCKMPYAFFQTTENKWTALVCSFWHSTRHSSALFCAASLSLLIFPDTLFSFVIWTFLLFVHPLFSSSSLNTWDWLSLLHFPLTLIAILTSPLSCLLSFLSLSVTTFFLFYCAIILFLSFHLPFCSSESMLIYKAILIFHSLLRDICILHLRMNSSNGTGWCWVNASWDSPVTFVKSGLFKVIIITLSSSLNTLLQLNFQENSVYTFGCR